MIYMWGEGNETPKNIDSERKRKMTNKMIDKLLEIAVEDREVLDTCSLMDSDCTDLDITAYQYKGVDGWFYTANGNNEYWVEDITQSWEDIQTASIWQRQKR